MCYYKGSQASCLWIIQKIGSLPESLTTDFNSYIGGVGSPFLPTANLALTFDGGADGSTQYFEFDFRSVGGELNASSEFQCYDELAFWSRPLTEEEVKKLYNGGAGSPIPVD